jgi:hypothetical protein
VKGTSAQRRAAAFAGAALWGWFLLREKERLLLRTNGIGRLATRMARVLALCTRRVLGLTNVDRRPRASARLLKPSTGLENQKTQSQVQNEGDGPVKQAGGRCVRFAAWLLMWFWMAGCLRSSWCFTPFATCASAINASRQKALPFSSDPRAC